jgi:hypothetical protein
MSAPGVGVLIGPFTPAFVADQGLAPLAETGKWFDHEIKSGGDIFALVKRERGLTDRQTFEWFEDNGIKPLRGNIVSFDSEAASSKSGVERKNKTTQFYPVAAWVYTDENGIELFRVCRNENGEIGKDGKPVKIYVQQRKPQAGYINGVNGVRQVPYKLPEIVLYLATVMPIPGPANSQGFARDTAGQGGNPARDASRSPKDFLNGLATIARVFACHQAVIEITSPAAAEN